MMRRDRDLPSVVVIDDEESVREGCRQVFEHEGFRAASAADGSEGLLLVERLNPRLVVVDLKMPGMDGMNVIRRVRASNPRIALIVITGYGSVETAVEAMKLGAADYLCKPFDDDQLLAAARSGLGRAPEGGGEPRPEPAGGAPAVHGRVIVAVLERAACDPGFVTRLTEQGSRALEDYDLSWDEKAALVSGDVAWIESRVGRLTDRQKTWLNCRLQQERW
jgi:DNA-binding response OmpR family regulator